MRPITLCFAGVMAMVMCVLIMSQLPSWGFPIVHYYLDRPSLDLPVATDAKKLHSPRGGLEISLNRKGRWVAVGRPFAEVDDLGAFLAEHAEFVREHGREPSLRLRIAGDAPARFMRDAAVTAEELGYESLLLAVHLAER